FTIPTEITLGAVLPELQDNYPEVANIVINWDKGLMMPKNEVKIGHSDPLAICHNVKTHKAHHDAILSNKICVSCKFTNYKPNAGDIEKQLPSSPSHTLL